MTEAKIEIEQIEEFTEELSDEALDREYRRFTCGTGDFSWAKSADDR